MSGGQQPPRVVPQVLLHQLRHQVRQRVAVPALLASELHILDHAAINVDDAPLRLAANRAAALDAGRRQIECVLLRPAQRQFTRINQALAAKKRLTIERLNGDDLPSIYADRDKITHVLGNLIGNAIKFTNDGGRIWISFSRYGRAGEEIPGATPHACAVAPTRGLKRP